MPRSRLPALDSRSNRAALYLRSSKDRADVSTDAQRRTLTEYAAGRGLEVVAEFVDEVESGKDTDRPGFRQLLAAVQDRKRGWHTLVMLDTSRLSRRRSISLIFEEHEAKPNGVDIVYKSIPDTDEITEMLLKSILVAMDEWHSLTSRQKGLAGMAENVRQGFRAGGRAPIGYRLKKVRFGTSTRDGEPVTKSVLEKDPETEARVQAYLDLRLAGSPRNDAVEESGLPIPASSAVNLEWSALTYAGCTVWNVNADKDRHAGPRRRPRAEWQIQPATHPAYISREQAEQLITRLENKEARREATAHTRQRAAAAPTSPTAHALLVGRLSSPDGRRWEYDSRNHYRLRAGAGLPPAAMDQRSLDAECLDQLITDLTTPEVVSRLFQGLRKKPRDTTVDRLTKQIQHIRQRSDRLLTFATSLEDPQQVLDQVNTLTGRRRALEADLAQAKALADQAKRQDIIVTPEQITSVVKTLKSEMHDPDDRKHLYPLVRNLIEEVVLDPSGGTAQILYKVSGRGGMASPRGFEPRSPP